MCSERYKLYQRVVMLKNHLICLSYQISVTLFIDGGKTQNGKLRMQARVKDKPVRKEKNDHIVLKLWGTTIVNQVCLQQVEFPFLVSFPDCKEYTHQRDKMRYNTTIFQCFASVSSNSRQLTKSEIFSKPGIINTLPFHWVNSKISLNLHMLRIHMKKITKSKQYHAH